MTKNDATNMLNNSKLDNKGSSWIWFWLKIKIDFGKNKIPVEIIKGGGAFGGTFSKIFILALIKNGIESHGKNFMIEKKLIKLITAQIIMIIMLLNVVLNVEYH